MEKFGLRTGAAFKNGAIELAIAKEQATALGRAGRKLRLSLEQYSKLLEKDLATGEREVAIDEISANTWALVLQREFLGFVDGNLEWVLEHYHIPKKALNKLGSAITNRSI